ncbi:MAG: SDR family oxidoreductase [Actinomycetota bacterium]|nr:MAG: SDR family oxidoreductase [Actinomycetota bacterium]
MDLQLDGRVALVTGGSRGIGLAIARTLLAEGATVAVLARDRQRLAAARDELAATAGSSVTVAAVAADTTDDAAVRAAVDRVTAELGTVQVLVNAAATPGGSAPGTPPTGVSDADLLAELDTKVVGYLRTARAVAPGMIERGWGRIINIGGLAARTTGTLSATVRNVGVHAVSKSLADELGPAGINVTTVHPGATVTERLPELIRARAAASGIDEADVARRMAAGSAIGRLVTADEIAWVVAFLASPRSVAINGDAVVVGGGSPGGVYY